jgi:hypothetical protein
MIFLIFIYIQIFYKKFGQQAVKIQTCSFGRGLVLTKRQDRHFTMRGRQLINYLIHQ